MTAPEEETASPKLRTRRLGRTGLVVTELGFGGANVAGSSDSEEALLRAFELGLIFVETGRMYRGSEYVIGRALSRLPDRGASVLVASKTFGRTRDAALHDLERTLGNLGLPKVDIYQLCDVRRDHREQVMGPGGALKGLREAQKRGLVRYVGISSHSHNVLRWAIESGEFDTVQLKYSAFNLRHEDLIRLAHERDIGVIVMKPLGGFGMPGELKASTHWQRLNARSLLRFALSNPEVSVVIPGMRFAWEVEENFALAATYEAMTPAEKAVLRRDAEAYLAESAASHPVGAELQLGPGQS
jgi:aryl-alcohol dehydrogenase-like predicted oxidoreductase